MRCALLALILVAGQPATLTIQGDADAVRVLGLSAADVQSLKTAGILRAYGARVDPPELFERYPVPQAVEANAKAGADLRAQGAKERDIRLGETVGAFVAEDGGYWFGKSFGDAEGDTGRGDIGFLTRDGRYEMLNLAELRRWSVPALIVDRDTIWAAMIHRGEGKDTGRGILRFDRKTKRVTIHDLSAPIHTLVRIGDRIFAGTVQGPFMLKDGVVTRLMWRN